MCCVSLRSFEVSHLLNRRCDPCSKPKIRASFSHNETFGQRARGTSTLHSIVCALEDRLSYTTMYSTPIPFTARFLTRDRSTQTCVVPQPCNVSLHRLLHVRPFASSFQPPPTNSPSRPLPGLNCFLTIERREISEEG